MIGDEYLAHFTSMETVISDFVRIERIHGFSCKLCGNCCRDRAVML